MTFALPGLRACGCYDGPCQSTGQPVSLRCHHDHAVAPLQGHVPLVTLPGITPPVPPSRARTGPLRAARRQSVPRNG